LLDKIVSVETLALYCKKQFSALYRARVDGVSLRKRTGVVVAGGGGKIGDSGKGQVHVVFPALLARAASQS